MAWLRERRTVARVARVGFVARGAVYMVVGGLAVLAAMNLGGGTTDPRGALLALLMQPFGEVLLAAIAFGLAAFALWRMLQAFLDADHHGRGLEGLGMRTGFAVSAAIHASLALFAIGLIVRLPAAIEPQTTGGTGAGGEHSADGWAAFLMQQPLGRWLVAAAAAIIVATRLGLMAKAVWGHFRWRLDVPVRVRRWAAPLSRFGVAAHGLVLAVIGLFLGLAAYHARAEEARGFGGALAALAERPYGWLILAIVALGLFAFGIHNLIEARYRRIDPPDLSVEAARAIARHV